MPILDPDTIQYNFGKRMTNKVLLIIQEGKANINILMRLQAAEFKFSQLRH